MDILIGVSNRHIHITEDDFKLLFEKDDELKNLEVDRYLIQPHQYASKQYVDIKTNKNIIKKVRILGPFRKYTQVELSRTDSIFLGINPPVVDSGDLENAEEIEIIGPYGSVIRKAAIIANRHIHITEHDKLKYNLGDYREVSVIVHGEKSTVFNNVKLKVSEEANLELHLDTDDANGALVKTGGFATIIKKDMNY